MTPILARLTMTPLFGGLQPDHRRRLAESAFTRKLAKGETLFREGEEGSAAFLLAEGAVQVYKTAPDGAERVIRVFRPGDLFAQVILFESARYPVTAVALSSAKVIGLYRRDLLALLEGEAFRRDFIAQLMQRQRYLADRIASLGSPDLVERLRTFLVEQYGRRPDIVCPLRRKDIAAAIGVTPETLSRLLARLKRRDVLTWSGERLRVSEAFWRGSEPVAPGITRSRSSQEDALKRPA